MAHPSNIPIDFGIAADDYATHRKGFPPSLIRRLNPLGVALPGQRLLDLGTGTGLFACQMAQAGCIVTGLDPSAPLLEKARDAARQGGHTIAFVSGMAEDTGLPPASFDVVAAATCWHWFNKARAATEARRLLKPGGRLVIAALDWHSLPGNIMAQTAALIAEALPENRANWRSTLQYPEWTTDLVAAGFTHWEMFHYIETIPYTHLGWAGRVRASQGVAPAMPAAQVAVFSDRLLTLLQRECPVQPMHLPHRISALVAWTEIG